MNYSRPVKEGEIVRGEILAKGTDGDGIMRVHNFVVFVSNTEIGETVSAQITQVQKHYAVAIQINENK